MPLTLVDANVLIDVLTRDATWSDWSRAAISTAVDAGGIAIDPIIYAEVSVGFERIEECELALGHLSLVRRELPWTAAFLAGKAFRHYRRAGGLRTSPLPDFYIGAHAAVAGMRLLTRDAGRYRTYFPRLELIAP